MSKIELINGSCADQKVDIVVNAANNKYKTPLKDGSAVITPAFNMTNTKAIISNIIYLINSRYNKSKRQY